MRNPSNILAFALSATVGSITKVISYYDIELGQSHRNEIRSECNVIDVLAIHVNVPITHPFVQQCVQHSVTGLDYDSDPKDGNAVIDVKWNKMPLFLHALEEYEDVEVLDVS